MANISTDNINTIAQLSASIDDEDYIYIFKVSSGTIARVTKAQLLQDIANSGGGISETVYAAIRNNVNTLQAKVDDIINIIRNNMANYVFPNGRPSINVVGQLYWPSGGETPVLTPVLISPSSDINATLEYGANSVTIPVNITGSNLTKPLTLAVNGAGFTPASFTIQASAANAGTSIVLTYARQQGAESATGSLSISSEDGISRTIDINVTFAQDQGGGGEEPSDNWQSTYDNIDGNSLLMFLDGKNQGDQTDYWVDRVHGLQFALNGSASKVNNKGVYFGNEGDSAIYVKGVNETFDLFELLSPTGCTIEVCFTIDAQFQNYNSNLLPFFVTNQDGKITCIYGRGGYKHFDFRTGSTNPQNSGTFRPGDSGQGNFNSATNSSCFNESVTSHFIGMNSSRVFIDGNTYTDKNSDQSLTTVVKANGTGSRIMIGGRMSGNNNEYNRVCHATIHAVRIYSGELTDTQMSGHSDADVIRYGTGNS